MHLDLYLIVRIFDGGTRPKTDMQRVTRGHGFLEHLLASLRANKANSLIDAAHRGGTIIDIGCGSYPLFLARTRFATKIGFDREYVASPPPTVNPGISLRGYDIHQATAIPIESDSANVVTMLAVFEHIQVNVLPGLLTDIHRVLRPGGVLVMTTPSAAAEPVLKFLTMIGGVSKTEIEEHTDHYSREKIRAVMRQTPFDPDSTEIGLFQFGMNVWIRARKHPL
jgi:2-polyprenyl-3-methyl-5-hydroxy-6-metoxy-1,4-benzoquinol methylase